MVIIVDPTVSNKKYDVYERGSRKNIFQKDKNGRDATTK
jgi:hypothetical protein